MAIAANARSRIDWDEYDVITFKKNARKMQQEYYNSLIDDDNGYWQPMDRRQVHLLQRKVGFGVYGSPTVPPLNDYDTGYTKEQLKVIDKICSQLTKGLSERDQIIEFACIFVVFTIPYEILSVFKQMKTKKCEERDLYTIPIFKCQRPSKGPFSSVYVDTEARQYESWDDYLCHNKLEKGIYCYPTRGAYEWQKNGEVAVTFGTTPAYDPSSKVFSALDKVATVAMLGAAGVGVAAMCAVPVAGPIVAGSVVASVSAGAYGASRSSYTLIDRSRHNQSIGLDNAESLGCWLSIAGSGLGFAQGRMIASMTNAARAGDVMSKAGRIAFMAVQVGNLTVNGVGVAHGLVNLIEKDKRGELNALDVLQFSAHVLFFCNASMNLKTANSIIKEAQHDVISSHREGMSKRAASKFNRDVNKLRGAEDTIQGNAKVVRGLTKIEDVKGLYEIMGKDSVRSGKVRLTENGIRGNVVVNKDLKIFPERLLQLSNTDRQAMVSLSKKFNSGSMGKSEYQQKMKKFTGKFRAVPEATRVETLSNFAKMFGKTNVSDIVIGDRKLFANDLPDRLVKHLSDIFDNPQPLVRLVFELAMKTALAYANRETFIEYLGYATDYVKAFIVNLKKKNGLSDPEDVTTVFPVGAKNDQSAFWDKTVKHFSSPEGMKELDESFEKKKGEDETLEKGEDAQLRPKEVTHNLLRKEALTVDDHLEIIRDRYGIVTDKAKAVVDLDGNIFTISYSPPQKNVASLIIERQRGENLGKALVTLVPDDIPKVKCSNDEVKCFEKEHELFAIEWLTEKQYFEIVQDLFEITSNGTNATVRHAENSVMISYSPPQRKVKSIVIKKQAATGSVKASVTVTYAGSRLISSNESSHKLPEVEAPRECLPADQSVGEEAPRKCLPADQSVGEEVPCQCLFVDHKIFQQAGDLTKEQYFEVVRDEFLITLTESNATFKEEEDHVIISYSPPQEHIKTLLIKRKREEGRAAVTVLYDSSFN